MATRDFKVRTGLIVEGNFTLGGKSVSRVLDSDEVTTIINSSVTGLSDSDLKAVADLRNDVDSDSQRIQTIQTDLDTAEANITTIQSDITTINAKLDSDELKLQALDTAIKSLQSGALLDSDLKAVADLRNDVDSDSLKIQSHSGRLDILQARADSDETVLQLLEGRITTLESTPGMTDSDLKVVADLRNDVDSDSIIIQSHSGRLDILEARADSDETQLQLLDGRITTLENAVDDTGFDSDQVVAIIGENTTSYDDTVVLARLDSDEIQISSLRTQLEGLAGTAAINTTVYTYTATQGQTTFSGADTNGLTLSYSPGNIYVFLNGILILDTTDYTATNGSSVVLVEAADSDNTLQVVKHVGTVQAGFDSEQVVAIIGENVTTDPTVNTRLDSDSLAIQALSTKVGVLEARADSDETQLQVINTAVGVLQARADSDETQLQTVNTTLGTLSTKVDSIEAALDSETARIQLLLLSTDSDALSIAGLVQEADSDAAAIAELLRQADSDAAAIQALRTDLSADISALQARADSDELAIQSHSGRLDILEARADSDETQLQVINTAVGVLQARADSDETQLQVINTAVGVLQARADSDETVLQLLEGRITTLESTPGIADSDLKVMADLRNDVDSDSIRIQSLQTALDGLAGTAAINTTVYTYTATQGQTTFSGADDNGLTLSYSPGKIYVFVNGVLVLDTTDYTATNGSSVVLTEAADSDNTVQIIKHIGTVQAGFDSEQVVAIIGENRSSDFGNSNQDTTGQTQQVIDSFATSAARSVKYFVSASSNDSSWFASEIIVIHDGTNAYLTEYGTISTHDSEFITFDADVNSGNVRLLATPSNSLTNVKTVKQIIGQS